MPIYITVGEGMDHARGETIELASVSTLGSTLAACEAALEGWWTPNVFANSHRSKSRWISSAGVPIDIDFDFKHERMPTREEAAALASQTYPGNFFHLTPNGARIAFAFAQQCIDRELQQRAQIGGGELVKRALDGLPYHIDEKALKDLAQPFFIPNTVARGVERHADVLTMRIEPYDPGELAKHVPPPKANGHAKNGHAKTNGHTHTNCIGAIVAKWNADHPLTLPRGAGECPVCGHHGCFGRLPDDDNHWHCFSTGHPDGVGIRGEGGHHGDALDLEAHERGCKTIDVLRADGYLSTALSLVPAVRSCAPAASSAAADAAAETRAFRPWRSRSYLTAVSILRNNARDVLDGRKIEFDEMSGNIVYGRELIHAADVSRIRANIEARFVGAIDKNDNEVGLQISDADITRSVEQVAHENAFHPVREYLTGLKWDGVPRLDDVATDILGAENSQINRIIIRKFFISAAARAMEPGCKVDTVLVLVGEQGALKSTFFSVLAGPWFVDTPVEIEKDPVRAYMALRSAWILEFAELESLLRARDQTSVKAFLSSQQDDYTPKHARYPVRVPRGNVIVGTWNPDGQGFLSDPTGERRYWPVNVGPRIDIELLKVQRDQLWAEAVTAFRQWVGRGRPIEERLWFLTNEESAMLVPVHDDHLKRDEWSAPVFEWLAKRDALDEISIAEILTGAIGLPKDRWEDRHSKRVGRILRASGEWKPNPNKGRGKSRTWLRTGVRGETAGKNS